MWLDGLAAGYHWDHRVCEQALLDRKTRSLQELAIVEHSWRAVHLAVHPWDYSTMMALRLGAARYAGTVAFDLPVPEEFGETASQTSCSC